MDILCATPDYAYVNDGILTINLGDKNDIFNNLNLSVIGVLHTKEHLTSTKIMIVSKEDFRSSIFPISGYKISDIRLYPAWGCKTSSRFNSYIFFSFNDTKTEAICKLSFEFGGL